MTADHGNKRRRRKAMSDEDNSAIVFLRKNFRPVYRSGRGLYQIGRDTKLIVGIDDVKAIAKRHGWSPPENKKK